MRAVTTRRLQTIATIPILLAMPLAYAYALAPQTLGSGYLNFALAALFAGAAVRTGRLFATGKRERWDLGWGWRVACAMVALSLVPIAWAGFDMVKTVAAHACGCAAAGMRGARLELLANTSSAAMIGLGIVLGTILGAGGLVTPEDAESRKLRDRLRK